jgi:hypothetical protein
MWRMTRRAPLSIGTSHVFHIWAYRSVVLRELLKDRQLLGDVLEIPVLRALVDSRELVPFRAQIPPLGLFSFAPETGPYLSRFSPAQLQPI